MSRHGHEPDCSGGLCCDALCGRGLDPAIYGDRATVAEYALAAMTRERDAARAEVLHLRQALNERNVL